MTYPEKIAYLYRYRDALRREKTIADEIEALRTEAAGVCAVQLLDRREKTR